MMDISRLQVTLVGQPVLTDFTAQFPPGSISCIIGSNGCGKTTLLRALAGLIPAQGGEVLLHGENLLTMSRRKRALKLAYLPQSRPVPQIPAGLLIEHGRFPHEGFSKRLDARGQEAIARAVELTDTHALLSRPLPALSGGERQRIYLAAALAQETEVLLLDEPTTFLDLPHQLELLELCQRLAQQGKTIVLVLHDLQQAFTFAHRICILDKGRVLCCAPSEQLMDNPVTREVFGCRVLPAEEGIYTCRLCR